MNGIVILTFAVTSRCGFAKSATGLMRRDSMLIQTQSLLNTHVDDTHSVEWKPHAVRNESHYCKHRQVFGNKQDFFPARRILREMVIHNDMSTLFVVGTNDGKDIGDLFHEKWYRPDKVRVYGWEIDSINIQKAQEKLKGHSELELIRAGVSDSDGQVKQVSGSDEVAGLYPSGAHGFVSSGQSVTTQRWDTFVKSKKISEVSYALIDVEGHEMAVINGMNLNDFRQRFPVFQYEVGGTWVDERHAGTMTQADAASYLGHKNPSLLLNRTQDGQHFQQGLVTTMQTLRGLGYRLYLMGYTGEDPVLAPVGPGLFENQRCNAQNGKFNVNSNVLAVLESAAATKPWLMHVVDELVATDAAMD